MQIQKWVGDGALSLPSSHTLIQYGNKEQENYKAAAKNNLLYPAIRDSQCMNILLSNRS